MPETKAEQVKRERGARESRNRAGSLALRAGYRLSRARSVEGKRRKLAERSEHAKIEVPTPEGVDYNDGLPSHRTLLYPLLQVIAALGGRAPARAVIEAVAERLTVPDEVRARTAEWGTGQRFNLFSRRVRWTKQEGIRRGFITSEKRGLWDLTSDAHSYLANCRPGVLVTIYESEYGSVLWGEAETAAAVIRDNCLNLILTSPPYPLNGAPKAYGNLKGEKYLDWLKSLAREWTRMLVDDGSMVLNLADVWNPQEPTLSLYQERLLLYLVNDLKLNLAQKFYWYNPAKLPSSEWVTVRRVRVKNVIENCYWLSKSKNPKADNRKVLRAYSELMRRLIARGGEHRRLRPCGHGDTRGAFGQDNGGAIPSNLITATSAGANDEYYRWCREFGLAPHPARLPEAVTELFVRMLTDVGDCVYDPLAGSVNLGKVCERLKREWIASERSLMYLAGSAFNVGSIWSVPLQIECAP